MDSSLKYELIAYPRGDINLQGLPRRLDKSRSSSPVEYSWHGVIPARIREIIQKGIARFDSVAAAEVRRVEVRLVSVSDPYLNAILVGKRFHELFRDPLTGKRFDRGSRPRTLAALARWLSKEQGRPRHYYKDIPSKNLWGMYDEMLGFQYFQRHLLESLKEDNTEHIYQVTIKDGEGVTSKRVFSLQNRNGELILKLSAGRDTPPQEPLPAGAVNQDNAASSPLGEAEGLAAKLLEAEGQRRSSSPVNKRYPFLTVEQSDSVNKGITLAVNALALKLNNESRIRLINKIQGMVKENNPWNLYLSIHTIISWALYVVLFVPILVLHSKHVITLSQANIGMITVAAFLSFVHEIFKLFGIGPFTTFNWNNKLRKTLSGWKIFLNDSEFGDELVGISAHETAHLLKELKIIAADIPTASALYSVVSGFTSYTIEYGITPKHDSFISGLLRKHFSNVNVKELLREINVYASKNVPDIEKRREPDYSYLSGILLADFAAVFLRKQRGNIPAEEIERYILRFIGLVANDTDIIGVRDITASSPLDRFGTTSPRSPLGARSPLGEAEGQRQGSSPLDSVDAPGAASLSAVRQAESSSPVRTVVHRALDFAEELVDRNNPGAAVAFLKQLLWDLQVAEKTPDIGRLAGIWNSRMGLKEGESDKLRMEHLPGVVARAEALLLLAREFALTNENESLKPRSAADLLEEAADGLTALTLNELVKKGLTQEQALLSCELWSGHLDDLLRRLSVLTAVIWQFLENFLERQNDRSFLASLALMEKNEKALNINGFFLAMREYAQVKQAVADYIQERLQAKGYSQETIARAQKMFREDIILKHDIFDRAHLVMTLLKMNNFPILAGRLREVLLIASTRFEQLARSFVNANHPAINSILRHLDQETADEVLRALVEWRRAFLQGMPMTEQEVESRLAGIPGLTRELRTSLLARLRLWQGSLPPASTASFQDSAGPASSPAGGQSGDEQEDPPKQTGRHNLGAYFLSPGEIFKIAELQNSRDAMLEYERAKVREILEIRMGPFWGKAVLGAFDKKDIFRSMFNEIILHLRPWEVQLLWDLREEIFGPPEMGEVIYGIVVKRFDFDMPTIVRVMLKRAARVQFVVKTLREVVTIIIEQGVNVLPDLDAQEEKNITKSLFVSQMRDVYKSLRPAEEESSKEQAREGLFYEYIEKVRLHVKKGREKGEAVSFVPSLSKKEGASSPVEEVNLNPVAARIKAVFDELDARKSYLNVLLADGWVSSGGPFVPTPTEVFINLYRETGVGPGSKVFDFGFGDARSLHLARALGADVTGYEKNRHVFEYAREIYAGKIKPFFSEKRTARFWGSGLKANLEEFDLIYYYLAGSTEDEGKFFRKVKRELKSGARFILYAPGIIHDGAVPSELVFPGFDVHASRDGDAIIYSRASSPLAAEAAALRVVPINFREFIRALWFESYYYWLWEKMLLKLRKKRHVIVLNVPEATKSGFRGQGTGYGEAGSKKLKEVYGRWSIVNSQTSDGNSSVGAVVQVSSSPVVDLNDPVWQAYLASRIHNGISRAELSESAYLF